MTQKQNRSLFREHALQRYMEKSDNDLLPHVMSAHIFWIIWILFGLVMLSCFFAWMERVPVFTHSSGVVKASERALLMHKNEVEIVVFVPTGISKQVHVGMPANAQIGSSHQSFDGTIITINPHVVSPEVICKQYRLTCSMAPGILATSVYVNMLVVVPSSMVLRNGTLAQVQIQTGSLCVLDLLPLFHQFAGDA